MSKVFSKTAYFVGRLDDRGERTGQVVTLRQWMVVFDKATP